MYGVLFFTSKSRVLTNGIPFINYTTNEHFTVSCKKPKLMDMWAKVHPVTHQLMELIGPIADYETEVLVLQHVYGLRYTYPSFEVYKEIRSTNERSVKNAITVDGPTTLDRDDAISVDILPNGFVLGIHITDLTKRLSIPWLEWALEKGSSAYWQTGTKPIFPPHLAHGELSLNKGGTYECLSLWLTYDNHGLKIGTEFGPSRINITENITYDEFHKDNRFSFFQQQSGKTDATEVIAWAMIQYNLYMATVLESPMLRVQEKEGESATYAWEGTHYSMDNQLYVHATSPIRRCSDFYNQCLYHKLVVPNVQIEELNKRMSHLRQFHYREIIMSLAYECKMKSMIVEAYLEKMEDEQWICILFDQKRILIPMSDSFYEEPICEALSEHPRSVECIGLHKNGKATLRIRLV